MERTIRLGQTTISIDFDQPYVRTTFDDGAYAEAWPSLTDDERATAERLGYPDVDQMTIEHDFCHTFLATEEGEPYSSTLWNVAHKIVDDYSARQEEARVLAFQRWMNTGDPGGYFFYPYLREMAQATLGGQYHAVDPVAGVP